MKHLIILSLLFVSLTVQAQQIKKEDYSTYKPCTECLDQWKSKGLENYGISNNYQSKRKHFANSQMRNLVVGIVGIFIAAGTYAIFNKTNNLANDIR